MLMHEDAELIDGLDAVSITFMLRRSPSEQAVTAEDNTLRPRGFRHCVGHEQGEFESRTLPWKPEQLALKLLVKLIQLLETVCAGRERDAPVRMKMVDMCERQECVQRRVDRSRYSVRAEGCQWIKSDHLVFVLFAPVDLFQGFQTIQIEQCKTGLFD